MPAALITGGGQRVGRALALALAGDGWDLAIHYRSSATEALETQRDCQALGVSAALLEGDLEDAKTIESLVESAGAVLPDLRLLINNASLFQPGSVRSTSMEAWNRALDVNLRAPFFLTQQFARVVESGSVINLLDATVSRGRPSFAAYSLSKAGLQLLTQMAARELAPSIRVNAIAPGPVLPAPGKDEDHLQSIARRSPLGTVVGLDDLITGMRYLLENKSVTGEVLYVDGGEHLGEGPQLERTPG